MKCFEACSRPKISRRSLLAGAVSASLLHALHAQQSVLEHGRITHPVPLPDFALVMADGSKGSLHRLLEGRATAIQLMFTACRTTCPMEGAVFERVQALVPGQVERGLQLMSLSVSSEGEPPGALAAWMRRFHAKPGWIAAAPVHRDLQAFSTLFGQGRSVSDPHTTQVQMVNRQGRLFWRSSELPSAEEVAELLTRL